MVPAGAPALILTNPAKGAIPLAPVLLLAAHAGMHLEGKEDLRVDHVVGPESKAVSGWEA